jgi:hypothetical protein
MTRAPRAQHSLAPDRQTLLAELQKGSAVGSPIFNAQIAEMCLALTRESLARPGVPQGIAAQLRGCGLLEAGAEQLPTAFERTITSWACAHLPEELHKDLTRPGQERLPAPEQRALAIATRLVLEATTLTLPVEFRRAGPEFIAAHAAADENVRSAYARQPAGVELSEGEWTDMVRDWRNHKEVGLNSEKMAFRGALARALRYR